MTDYKRLLRHIRRNVQAVLSQPKVAAALIWRRIGIPRTTVIAITGSTGKSTATACLVSILQLVGSVSHTDGGNGRSALPKIILRTRRGHRFLVLESGIRQAGRMWRTALLTKPDIAVITAVNWQHAVDFRSIEEIATEKSKLLNGLPPGGLAVLNADDPRVAAMPPGPGRRVVTFGLGEGAQVRGSIEASAWPDRLALTVEDEGGRQRLQTQLIGAHWAPSVLAAVAVARSLGASWDQCAQGVARTPPFVARLEPITLPSGAVLLRDEYNGSWATLKKALRVLEDASAQRKILVLGNILDAPDFGEDRAGEIGRHIARVPDLLLAWGKSAGRYCEAAHEIRPELPVEVFEAQSDLAAYLRRESRAGDLILLKGYWFDHLTRVVYEQFGETPCKLPFCAFTGICDRCSKLAFRPDPSLDPKLLDQLSAGKLEQL